MKYNISITELAQLEIQEYFDDYNQKREGLGEDFENEIIQNIEYIQKEAQTIQIRYNTIRISFLKQFPFGIHFQMNQNEVLIIGVYPMKGNPRKWRTQPS